MSEQSPPLAAHEELLEEGAELLWRQVHPTFVGEDGPDPQAFNPSREHKHCLSVARAAKVDAAEAYRRHTNRGLRSGGTWAMTVREVLDVELRAVDDSAVPERPDEHAYVDFRVVAARRDRKIAAGVLADRAARRGCQHQSP